MQGWSEIYNHIVNVIHWHRLLREIVDAPSLGSVLGQVECGFKQSGLVDGALLQGRLELDDI